jgi:diguanylate cyclase (GGDEF)-like protein
MFIKNSSTEDNSLKLTKLLGKSRKELATLAIRVEELEKEKTKNSLTLGITTLLTNSTDLDTLLKSLIILLRNDLSATYAGLFTYFDEEFLFWKGVGFKRDKMRKIPLVGSVMGEVIQNEKIIAIDSLEERYYKVSLNQTPNEYNTLIIPIITNDKIFGVIRVSNLSTENLTIGEEALNTVLPLITKMISHIQVATINNRVLKGMTCSLSITRLLEKNLDKFEVLDRIFKQISSLFPSNGKLIALKGEDNFIVTNLSPEKFYLGGNPDSQRIYVRNLISEFPSGEVFFTDLVKTKKWYWGDNKHRSLCMVPIIINRKLSGVIIVTAPPTTPLNITDRTLLQIIASQSSTTLEKSLHFKRQEQFATKDGLTSLYNRRMFDDSIKKELEKAQRYNRPVSLIMFDIDHFKNFNDEYGHDMGDAVLIQVAKVVMKSVRDCDLTFRYGGEEFIIICPETESKHGYLLANRVRENIAADRSIAGVPPVTVSLGVTQIVKGDSVATISKRVDQLMYASKEGGRNQVTLG